MTSGRVRDRIPRQRWLHRLVFSERARGRVGGGVQVSDLASRKITVFDVWQLHLRCAKAISSNNFDTMRSALLNATEVLGAELTRILKPAADELEGEK